jgi:electron transfer flavoprotein alpha subunit
MQVAHVAVVGDAYEILPQWIEALKKGSFHV